MTVKELLENFTTIFPVGCRVTSDPETGSITGTVVAHIYSAFTLYETGKLSDDRMELVMIELDDEFQGYLYSDTNPTKKLTHISTISFNPTRLRRIDQ